MAALDASEISPHLLDPPFMMLSEHPASPEDSDSNVSSTTITMTTYSGAPVTTATTQSRRHSSAIPYQTVTPSRRQSAYDMNHLFPPSANESFQSLNSRVHSLQISVGYLENITKEWQANSSHTMEQQMTRATDTEQAILDNQQRIQDLQAKLDRLRDEDSRRTTHFYNLLIVVGVAVGSFALGRLLKL